MKKEKIDELTFYILRGKNKKQVFSIITNNPSITQAQIFKQTQMHRTHVGRTVRELENKSIIECINPKEKTYKLYKPTKIGLEIKENINKYTKE